MPRKIYIRRPVIERFLEKVNKNGPIPTFRISLGRCWSWRGGIGSQGQSAFWLNGKTRLAYRCSYELLKGAIPEGLVLDHLCRNRSCVNPEHLEPVTLRENILRGIAPAAINARKRECKNGHPFSGENLVMHKGRHGMERNCRICKRERLKTWRHRMGIHKRYYRPRITYIKKPVDVSR